MTYVKSMVCGTPSWSDYCSTPTSSGSRLIPTNRCHEQMPSSLSTITAEKEDGQCETLEIANWGAF